MLTAAPRWCRSARIRATGLRLLAQPELFFSTLTGRLLRRGEFTSRIDLAARIDDFVPAYDKHDAKPYRWTYDGTPLKAA